MRGFVFVLLLLAAGVLHAQSNADNNGAAYEGEPVASIHIVANPHVDIHPLEAMLAQKPGQPYSQKLVDSSAAALHAAGQFEKVRVVITQEPKGLRLAFVLEPAYYIGVLDFPGATKRFSYTRLLQVVKYSDEDPYDQAALPEQETALRDFLKQNGYFQAEVHAETHADDSHQLVDIVFRVQMGKRARIGDVRIEGPGADEAATFMHSVTSLRARLSGGFLRPGKTYTVSRLREASRLLKRELSRQHYLASKIQQLPPNYHPQTNLVDVVFHIDLGPTVMVRVAGAKLTAIPFASGREERKLIPIYSEGTIDRDLVDEGQQNLIDYFQKKGYFDVQVKTDYQRQTNKISLTYQVTKGKKHKVSNIILEGNRALDTGDLLAHIPVKKSHIWTRGAFSDKLVKTSVDNIEALYRDAGYEEAKVTPKVVDHEPRVDITFTVVEGPRTTVDNVSVTGNDSISREKLFGKDGPKLRPGAPFSPGKMVTDRNQISATYLDGGYLNVDVKAVVSRHNEHSNQVDVAYEITEHQMVRTRQVLYRGQKHTRVALLTKKSGLKPETPLSQKSLLGAETQLYNLDIFDWTSVGPRQPITDQTDEDTVVRVHEAKRTEIVYGFGFEVSHRGGNIPAGSVAVPGLPPINIGNGQVAPSQAIFASPRGSISILRHNMRGLGETASFSLLASRLDQRVVGSYADPNFRRTQWDGLTSFSFERSTENPLFAANLADASFQLERVISKKTNTRVQFRYDFNHTALSELLVPELVLPQDRNVRLSTVSAALIHDTRDKPLDAHRGVYSTVNLSITPTAFGSSANFARLFAQYAVYKPVHGIIWASSIRLGMAKAFSGSFVPTSQLFFAGGGTTLRGFPINEAGPQRIVPFCNVLAGNSGCVNVTVPVGGRELFVFNTELRFPLKIMQALGGVVFYDGGNVYSAININQFVNNFSNTIGIGLRYSTPIGPIRLDFGRNLNPVPGIGATQYFITLGQAF